MTLTIGAWIVPAFITLAAFTLAIKKAPSKGGDYDFASGFIALLFVAIAAVVSLIAWLVWALL